MSPLEDDREPVAAADRIDGPTPIEAPEPVAQAAAAGRPLRRHDTSERSSGVTNERDRGAGQPHSGARPAPRSAVRGRASGSAPAAGRSGCSRRRTAEEAEKACHRAVAEGVAALVAVGGDGTVHQALQAVAERPVGFGVVPGRHRQRLRRRDGRTGRPAGGGRARSPRPCATRDYRAVDLARMTGAGRRGALVRGGAGGRLRRDRQRAGQPDALAARPAPLRPGDRPGAGPAAAPGVRAGAGRRRPRLRGRCWWRSATARATAAGCASCPAPTPPTGCWTWWSRRRWAGPPWPGSSRGCAAGRTSTDPRVTAFRAPRVRMRADGIDRVRGRRARRAAAVDDHVRAGRGPVAALRSAVRFPGRGRTR